MDPIPTTILSNSLNTLSPILLHITNTIITENYFPPILKHAQIKPTIKNPKKSADDLSNQRPLSSLPFVSKIVERVLYIQLENFLEENKLHAHNQSAYRKFNSCETAMINIIDEIQQHLLDKNYVAMILLDNSCAFDTVDHKILCSKLKKYFNFGNNAIKLIESYLSNRSFSVIINDAKSTSSPLYHGVPQGSLLGPLLYIIYTKEIENIARKFNININLYADDVQLYVAFNLNNQNKIKSNLLECITEIKTWNDQNFLKINMDKTQFKLFKPNKMNINYDINYNGIILENLDVITVLGVTITKDMDMSKFISKKVQLCHYKLRNLVFIKKSLPYKSRIIMITNLILTNLDYCNCLLACASQSALKPLQLMLNRAVRFVFNQNKFTHITCYLKKLHFLPIKHRIIFKTCLIAFKVIHGMAPENLKSKFSTFVPTSSSNLRLTTGRDPYMFNTTIDDHRRNSIINKIKINWNSLPLQIRQLPYQQIQKFKTELKTHLFKIAYEDS